jgi:Di-haem cytochrome c peroxidase
VPSHRRLDEALRKNPPGNPKARYFVNRECPTAATAWRAGAEAHAGSWWDHWRDWLGARSGDRGPAPARLGDDHHPAARRSAGHIGAQTIERLAVPPDNQVQQIELLGKLLLCDKQLSVNRNEACAFCHMPEAGSTGPVSELNRTTGSYPGSVRTRFSNRKPQSHAYAPLSPVLHYNPGQGDVVGGNFWDMRATGRRLGNPAAEQAEGPPTNPVEMGLPDIACAVYGASQRPYRAMFESVWGQQAFAIAWPGDVEQVCDRWLHAACCRNAAMTAPITMAAHPR